MAFVLAAIIGGTAAGAGKYFLHDKPKQEQEKYVQSETTRYSPQTHMVGKEPGDANLLGNMVAGGVSGLGIAGGIQSMQADKAAGDAYTQWLASPNGQMALARNGPGMISRGRSPASASSNPFGMGSSVASAQQDPSWMDKIARHNIWSAV